MAKKLVKKEMNEDTKEDMKEDKKEMKAQAKVRAAQTDAIITYIKSQIAKVQPEVEERNAYIDERHGYIYENKMLEDSEIPADFDETDFNFAPRVVDIHTSQLMGKGFFIGCKYDKKDTTIIPKERLNQTTGQMVPNPEYEEAKIENEDAKMRANFVKKLIDSAILDNGGFILFKDGARIGTSYGTTVIKYWVEKVDGAAKPKIKLLEKIRNYYAVWKEDDFRERSADIFEYRIEVDEANRRYGHLLKNGETFSADNQTEITSSDDISQEIPMCTIVDYTGVHPLGKKKDGKDIIVNILSIGNTIVSSINMDGDEAELVPSYILVRNKLIPGQPYGASDINNTFISLNIGYIERMSEETTKVQKFHFPLGLAIGYNQATIPKKNKKEIVIVPASPGQDIKFVQPPAISYEYPKIMDEIKEAMAKVSGVGRVMFENPQINYDSAEALMMGMKPILDTVEEKQSRWEPELLKMFNELIIKMAAVDKNIRKILPEDYEIYIEWPSVLRKESAAYRTMLLNDLQRGAMSLESYLEKTGNLDPSEELDRIRTEVTDHVIGPIVNPSAHQMIMQMEQMEEQEDQMEMQQQMQAQQMQGVQGQAQPTLTQGQNQESAQPLPQKGQQPTASPEGALNQVNYIQ